MRATNNRADDVLMVRLSDAPIDDAEERSPFILPLMS